MSKGKRGNKIKSFLDIQNRPKYKQILEFINRAERPVTSGEIKENVFPGMVVQTLNDYLRYLVKFGLIQKNKNEFNRVTFRANNKEENFELMNSAPMPSLNEMMIFLKNDGKKPSEIKKFCENIISQNDKIEKHVLEGKINCSMPLTYTSRQYIFDILNEPKKEITDFLELSGQATDLKITVEYGNRKIEIF